MKSRSAILVLVALGFVVAGVYLVSSWLRSPRESPTEPFSPSLEPGAVVKTADYTFSSPATHANLTIFLIHGKETLDGKTFLTLQEALEQKKVIVHETGNVNQLTIENTTPGEEVYVQSGDIVKGGKQDRTLPHDTLVGPASGQIPIDSFCVEHGRWSGRKAESATSFDLSSSNIGISELRRAAYAPGESSQAAVWENVARTQERLSQKLGTSVRAAASQSSLQLTLEHPALRESLASYTRALGALPEGQDDVIGYIAVVNGKILSADVYASRSLFRKLWPKLLEGSATEAFLEASSESGFTPPSEEVLRKFLTEAEAGRPSSESITARTCVQVRQGDRTLLFESCDRSRQNLVLHRGFLAR
jgi:hypothetical protein